MTVFSPVPRSRLLRISSALIALVALAFVAGGAWLLMLGGTSYYLLAGAGLGVVSALLWRAHRVALWVFALVYVYTVAWALYEVGLDGWKLEPRLLLPTLLGLLLLTPPYVRRLGLGPSKARAAALGLGLAGVLASAVAGMTGVGMMVAAPQDSRRPSFPPAPSAGLAEGREWRYYGNSPRGERFSPLAQITPRNVSQLELAWKMRTGDMPRDGENKNGYEFNFEATPIKVGDTLYLCTPHRQVIALDPQTGAVHWRFDPQPDTRNNAYLACRGVAFHEAASLPVGALCRRRILSTTADARLMALDAEHGTPCPGFGDHGYVSLRAHLGEVPPGFHFITSQPLVAYDRVILGGWIYDGQKTDESSGVVRAFDPVTGALLWAWDLGRDDQAVQHPPPDMQFTRGTPNAWGTYTADLELGLVFLPLGNAVPDYYGAKRRPFDERFSSSVVALDIDTGQPRWHFQTTHHDLWDMDVPIGPTLVDLPTSDGTIVPALVQTTKRGELFLLDRRDGRPLAEVAEKPSPQGGLPEEEPHLARTQPHSVGMPAFGPPRMTERDVWGATPLDQLVCRIEFKRMRYEGALTPITEQKTLVFPAFDGVIDWHGAAVDPQRRLLFANLSYIPFTAQMFKRADAEAQGLVQPWNGQGTPPRPKEFAINPQYGTPYVAVVRPWLNALGVPCKAPPWGQLAAVDLVKRRILWQHEAGTTRDTGPFNLHFNLPLTTGVFNIGGPIVTAGGLVFIGAYADNYLRAFDASTGAELWRTRLPAGGQATPMTYAGRDGRQYIVIAAGGHGGLRTSPGDYVMAYALPRAP